MLYSLFNYYSELPGARLMTYISFRAIIAAVIALVTALIVGKYYIDYMRRHNISEQQRDAATDPFGVQKKGVPTMGGLIILLSTIVPCLLMGRLGNVYMLLMLATTVILGALGFADDYIKTFRHNKEGLNGWVKIAGQVTLGLVVGLTLRYSPDVLIDGIKSTQTTIPFVKMHNCNYADLFSWLGPVMKYQAGWIFFVAMVVFVVAAVSNGANLNDGMDGMCAGNSLIIAIALIALAYISGNTIWSDYFDVMYIPGSEEIVVFLGAFVGALVGFLWWNAYPAEVFMGDTGSLAIGGIIAVSAICVHKELLIPILCGVFLMESVSVILQTQVYKFSKKRGHRTRVFKRAPLHDHYRTSVEQVLKLDPTCRILLQGRTKLDHEVKIVVRFCIATLILAAFTILTLKIR